MLHADFKTSRYDFSIAVKLKTFNHVFAVIFLLRYEIVVFFSMGQFVVANSAFDFIVIFKKNYSRKFSIVKDVDVASFLNQDSKNLFGQTGKNFKS